MKYTNSQENVESCQSPADAVETKFQPIPLDKSLPFNTCKCMPAYEEIPREFKSGLHPWSRWQSKWFFEGLGTMPAPKEEIDGAAAYRHLNYIQRSFDTKHEHKAAAVAYLASLWFVGPTNKDQDSHA